MANLLTLSRMLLVIPFTAMFFINAPWAMNGALAVFAIASATDFFDGRVARARREISALGAALDPVADKLLIAAALLLLTRNGVIAGFGVLAALAILLRELLVGGLREALGAQGAPLAVTASAKWKTAAQMIAVALLLAAAPGGALGDSARAPAQAALWLAALLTVWTGASYCRRAVRLFRRSRGSLE